MKKRIRVLCLVLACVLVLSGCGCKHETWNEADCLNPKTCAECGEVEGEALGHTWVDADCVNAKTCSACGETEGEALGHTWVDADCVNAKTCSACGEVEGEALGHTWVDATTEAPKTCTACGETEGERIITDERFATAEAQPYFGTWEGNVTASFEALGFDVEGEYTYTDVLTFGNDGTLTEIIKDMSFGEHRDALKSYITELLKAEFTAQGVTEAQFEAFYGMTLEDMAESTIKGMEAGSTTELVYYVEDGVLYLSSDWNSEMVTVNWVLDGDTMQVDTLDGTIFNRIED